MVSSGSVRCFKMNLMRFVPCWWNRQQTYCRYDMFAMKSPNVVLLKQIYFPTAAVFFLASFYSRFVESPLGFVCTVWMVLFV